MSVVIAVFLVLLLIGAPVYLSLLLASLAYFAAHPEISSMMIMQKLYGSLDSFVLVAIPLFMFAGNIMNTGGITRRIFGVAKAIVGHKRGGLAYVNIIASFIFAGMSGSALADVGGLGKIEMEAMRNDGYDDQFTVGVTAASATLGPIVPPSIPMVIYGAVASVSVGALFAGGIVPGLTMAALLCLMVHHIAKKTNAPVSDRVSFRELLLAVKESILALLMPLIILGCIWNGNITPTEAAGVAIMYAALVIILFYKGVGIKDVIDATRDAVTSMAPTMLVVIASVVFGWVLQFERMDQKLMDMVLSLSDNKTTVLLMINVMLLIFGMFMDATPVIMLLVPMLIPLANAMGINQIHLGVIVVLNLMIGLLTPPIGGTLNILSGVTKKKFEDIVIAVLPWYLPLLLSMLVVTYWEGLVLFVPKLLGFC